MDTNLFSLENALVSRYRLFRGNRIHVLEGAYNKRARLPVVIFIHGWAISSVYFIPLMKKLTAYKLFAPDMPGYGNSYNPSKFLSLRELAKWLGEWMTASRITKAALVGNSSGCQVLVHFALLYPEKIEKIIFLGPTTDPFRRTYTAYIKAFLKDGQFEPKEQRRVSLAEILKLGFPRACKLAKDIMNDRPEKSLPKITAPTLVMRGGKDPFVSQQWAEKATELLPHGSLVVIPEKGHTLNTNAPEKTALEIEKFISR